MPRIRKQSEDLFWRELPLRSAVPLLVAMATTFASLGFLIDLIEGGAGPFADIVALAVYTGMAAAGLGIVIFRKRQWLVPAAVAFCVLTATLQAHRGTVREPQISKELQARFATDAALMVALSMIGYGLSIKFITDTGVQQMRVKMELRLASEIQQGLVPDIAIKSRRFEICGRSSPGAEVGGDLVDAIEAGSSAVAYVADVSGHGVPAGLLTGIVKTAARSAVEKEVSLEAVLGTINRVLPTLQASNMYATFAGLVLGLGGEVRYATAGHGPILLYRAATGAIERLGIEQFPLGMFPQSGFESACAGCESGDLFVVVSDGFAEVVGRSGAEFGIDGVERVVAASAREPLTEIRDRLFREVRMFGEQSDDQTVLLVRVV
jgi:serine phosphatase RsbU (regulator of sigma subunit)